MRDTLLAIFKELDERIEAENAELEAMGGMKIRPVEVQILGQITLLANEMVASILPLARTNDLDAVIKNTQGFVTRVLIKEILPNHGLHLDSDSEYIWIPPGSEFELFHDFKNVRVKLLDPESALVSKAVKAKEKNKVLIVDAIASGEFLNLVQRIEENGGDLEYFVGDENEDE
jgi:hypothetical protein